jgi:hypothetical protein
MSPLDKLIKYMKETMVANAPGTSGGFSASSDPKGPVAGNTYKLPFKEFKRKRYIYQKNTRKNWM